MPEPFDRSKGADEGLPDPSSRSPQLNEVIEEARRLSEGGGSLDSLKSAAARLEGVAAQMLGFFRQESRFQEKTPGFLKDGTDLEEGFKSLRHYMERLKKYFAKPEERYLVEGLRGCAGAFEKIFSAIDRIEEREKQGKTYSPSPFMNEVARVAHCVLKGTLPPDTLRDRLLPFLKMQEEFYKGFDGIVPSPDERLILEENREAIRKALAEMIEGLRRVKAYLQDSNPRNIERGLEKACAAADIIAGIEEKLRQAREAPRVKLCFKCGAENSRSARFCARCNFSFPPLQMEEESTLDLRIDEGGLRQSERALTRNVMRLCQAVEDVKKEKIDGRKFLSHVDWFAGLIESARKEEAKIKEPETWEDSRLQELFSAVKETFQMGISSIEAGLSSLRMYPDTGSPNLLETGLEKVLHGADFLLQVQGTVEQLKAGAGGRG